MGGMGMMGNMGGALPHPMIPMLPITPIPLPASSCRAETTGPCLDRTVDQMIQAARSGKQNIIEGSKAAITSKETEIKLTNVARASLEELLEDYRDYLRVRDLGIWERESREARYASKLGMTTPMTFAVFREFTETRSAEVVANLAICLINQANFLLDRQLKALENAFLQDGGLRERMTRARLEVRDQQSPRRDP